MKTIHIVTDSTADIPTELANEIGIHVIPLNVHFGSESFKDQTELSSDDFFTRLVDEKTQVRTSQPSPGEFAQLYRNLTEDGSSVISMHLSAHLSGTMQSATVAKQDLGDQARIEIIDTESASMAFGLRVMETALLAKSGASFEKVLANAKESGSRAGVFFAVDTLDYLYANGRIGKAAHLFGSLLKMKPLLTLKEGVVTPYENVRGRKKLHSRLLEVLGEHLPKDRSVDFAVVHGNAEAVAHKLAGETDSRFDANKIIIGSLGAVVGAHVGPGSVAICYLVNE